MATEFYRAMWQVLGLDYFQMIIESIDKGTLPEGIIEGLIALLHKGGEQESLNNWRFSMPPTKALHRHSS